MLTVSIIIPVLNEAQIIENNLVGLRKALPSTIEIILVDGGSTDNTSKLASPFVDQLIVSEKKGRAEQMNLGSKFAKGEILLFLHVDTILSKEAFDAFTLANKSSWGFFKVKFTSKDIVFKMISFFINIRSRLTSVATGDQCLFVKKSLFDKLGGFASIPLMEDVEISKRLRKLHKPTMIQYPLVTSSRRWEQKGVLKTILLMWRLRLAYFLGKHPDQLVKQYY